MKRVLITAGGTREPIDDVRFVTNVSTGKLGLRIASEFLDAGFKITLLLKSGPILDIKDLKNLPIDFGHKNLKLIRFTSCEDLYKKMEELLTQEKYLAVIHSAAVADYTPIKRKGKIPSGGELKIEFQQTPKIIRKIKDWNPRTFLVGFKLETLVPEDKLIAVALSSLKTNRADLVIANNLSLIKKGKHRALFVTKNGLQKIVKGKKNIAYEIVFYVRKGGR